MPIFFGKKNANIKLDTGDFSDGALESGLFKKELQEQKAGISKSPIPVASREDICLPKGRFGDVTYTNLMMGKCPIRMWFGQQNLIGLRFFARNLVTFNFPKGVMYLKPLSEGPLPDDLFLLLTSIGAVNSQSPTNGDARFLAYVKQKPGGALWLEANEFLEDLKKTNQLPGWSTKDDGFEVFNTYTLFELVKEIDSNEYPATRTLNINKKGESLIYHYAVVKTSKDSSWKLQRAWQTDTDGHVVKEFPIKL